MPLRIYKETSVGGAKYQVVIPEAIRNIFGIERGDIIDWRTAYLDGWGQIVLTIKVRKRKEKEK